MPLKHLEHEGDEDFLTSNRQETSKLEKKITKIVEEQEEEMLNKLQEKWMNVNNPFLWDGEI